MLNPVLSLPVRPARTVIAVVVAVLALALPAVAPALDLNGFLAAPGEGAAALSYTMESYDEFWRGEERTSAPPLGEVETSSASLWFRWGFTDRLSMVANLPYVQVDTDGPAGFEDDGLGDAEAMLLLRALEVTSGDVRHRLVAGVGGRTAVSDYVADAPVSLGDGSDDLLLRLVYQLQVGSFYVSQQVGYELRGDDVPDALPLFTEAGYTFGRLTASASYKRLFADGGTDIGDPGFTFPSNQEEYSRLGAKLYGRLNDRFGAFVAGFTTLDGRNTGDATGLSVGVVLDF